MIFAPVVLSHTLGAPRVPRPDHHLHAQRFGQGLERFRRVLFMNRVLESRNVGLLSSHLVSYFDLGQA